MRMTRARWAAALLGAALACSGARAGSESSDAAVPVSASPSPAGQTTVVPAAGESPLLPSAPGAGLPAMPSAASVSAAAAAAGARASAAPVSAAGVRTAPSASAASRQAVPMPGVVPPARARAAAAAARGQLSSAAGQLRQDQGSGGSATAAAEVFRRLYDQSRLAGSVAGAAPSSAASIAGRDEPVALRVGQLASLAAAASPYDAPKLYQAALDQTRAAVLKKLLSAELSRRMTRALFHFAGPQGRAAQRALAQDAAGAAQPEQARRALSAIRDWGRLFDSFGKPLPSQDAATRARVAIAHDHLRSGGVPASGQAARAAAEGAVAALPALSMPDVSREPGLTLGESSTWLDDALAAHASNPGTDPSLLYRIARQGARELVPAALSSASAQAVRGWLSEAWHWLLDFWARFFGPEASVDLGGGVVVRGPAGDLTGLAAFKRAPSSVEAAAAAGGVAVASLDLASLNRPFVSVLRLLSAPGPMSEERLQGVLEQGGALARASVSATGDPSGLREYQRIEARLSGAGQLRPVDEKLLVYWLGAMRDAALWKFERPAAETARRKPVVLCDLSPDGLILVAAPRSRSRDLRAAGLTPVRSGPAAVVARLSLAGLGAAQRRGALEAVVAAAAGLSAPPAQAATRRQAEALWAYARAHEAAARQEARRLDAEDALGLRRFTPVGRLETPRGRFLMERSRRVLPGRLEESWLLRDEATRRAVFAETTASPLPR